jgi:outer membrane receptor protein involved in Fe transport
VIEKNRRVSLFASSMITSVALIAAGSVHAQVSPAQAAAAQAATGGNASTVGEVVITGSRIPQPNLTSASPVSVVTNTEIKLEGTTNIETLLNNLPMVSPDFGLTSDNGTVGGANVDLRGLGSKRTLVLIDGKRLQPGDPLIPVPDLDIIPAALVDRIDVLTGGASAVYGSDAVAGVVNFIMRKDFEGVRLDAQYGIYDYNNNSATAAGVLANGLAGDGVPITGAPHGTVFDGSSWDVTALIGANAPDGKGNITAYAEYRHVDPILQSARDYSYCALATTNGAAPFSGASPYNTHLCLGSSNSAYGKFEPTTGPSVGSTFANNPNGTNSFVPYTGALDYNFAPDQYLQSENQRYSAGFFAHYDVNKYITAYSDFMFASNDTQGQLGPSGLFDSTVYNINCNNPLLTAGGTGPGSQAAALCGANAGTSALASTLIGYRFADVSGAALPRDYDYLHQMFKIDVGMKGDLGGGWSYDVYAQYGYTRFNETITGQMSIPNIQNALEVNPNGTCFVGGSCVPLNIFQVGGVTTAMANYLSAPGLEVGYTQEQIVEADIVGDLGHYGIKSPFAKDGFGVAFGADYRGDQLGLTVDALTAAGDISGSGGATPPANGGYTVKELYGELRMPLVQDMPFFRLLEVDGGYRFSSYSTAGNTNTYKITGQWSPVEDVLLRGGFNRAVRAPNVVELFTPQTFNLFSGNDPCAGKVITPGSANYAGCIASGATPAQLASGSIPTCPAGQCQEVVGGNPALKPEESNTYTAGIVLTPHWVRGLSLSVDYFNIDVQNVIETGLGGAAVELSQCVATSNPIYCDEVHRDPILGSIFANGGEVSATNINAGALQTDGVDVEFNYRFKFSDFFHLPDWGGLNINYVGTYTFSLTNTPIAGGGSFNCAGYYGAVCGTPTPLWRSKLRVTWTPPSLPITLSAQWRYLGGVDLDLNSSNPFMGIYGNLPDTVPGEAHIPAYSYFDISGTWRVKDKLVFRWGINNLLQKNPPVLDTENLGVSALPFGNANTYPNVYDSLGRELFVGVTADF